MQVMIGVRTGLGYAMGHGLGPSLEWIQERSGILGFGILVGLLGSFRRRTGCAAPTTREPAPETPDARPEVRSSERVRRADWLLTARQATPRVFTLVRHLRPTMHLPSVRAI